MGVVIHFVFGLYTYITQCHYKIKELSALRGYFGPPMRSKNEIRFSPNSSYVLVRTIAQVYKSD